MKKILLSVLGICACTTLSLFAAKSDNLCPKCKSQVNSNVAYDDEDGTDDDEEAMTQRNSEEDEEEAMRPTIAPEGRKGDGY